MLRIFNGIKRRSKDNPLLRRLSRDRGQASVVDQSPFDNIYHCCTQKTASQWFKAVFKDPVFYRYTGLEMVPYVALGLRDAHFDTPFQTRSIATHLYVDYPTYASIPKPPRYRTFFILRDPRDALVSWYFSMKYSHPDRFDVVRALRQELTDLNIEDGIAHLIQRLDGFGFFAAQRSWVEGPVRNDPNVRIFRYEDLAADNLKFLAALLEYLQVRMPSSEIEDLWERHNFRRLSGGREQGQEDVNNHYRKGVAGDWHAYFTPSLETRLRDRTDDLITVLGYE